MGCRLNSRRVPSVHHLALLLTPHPARFTLKGSIYFPIPQAPRSQISKSPALPLPPPQEESILHGGSQ
jgi:hypothetical protein